MAITRNINDDNTLSYLFNQVWDKVYPVGAIYISSNATSPEKLFGGKWKPIEDKFLLSAGSTYRAGDTGGKANYVAADMPKHSHTRGTMEITGAIGTIGGGEPKFGAPSGAFYANATTNYLSTTKNTSGYTRYDGFKFQASKSWTGSTSESGTNTTAEIMPPYRVVYAWERTA